MIVNIPENKNGHRVYVMIYEVYLNKVIFFKGIKPGVATLLIPAFRK